MGGDGHLESVTLVDRRTGTLAELPVNWLFVFIGAAPRTDWLSRHDVTRDWVPAPALTGAGADADWCERVTEALGEARLEPGLEWVASTLSATGLLAEVKESTRRISDLVAAVKSYSQLDRASMQQTDLAEGLKSTLAMLAHRIPTDVTVVQDHGPHVPRIEALAAEPNQVWTNLGAGRLRERHQPAPAAGQDRPRRPGTDPLRPCCLVRTCRPAGRSEQ